VSYFALQSQEVIMSDQFEPNAAADLLVSTRRQARQGFEQRTPPACVFFAVVVLAIYGLLWFSVRDQHPYAGPSGPDVVWAYAILAISITVSVTTYRRAMRGVSGRSRREHGIAGLAVAVPWVAVYVFNSALQTAGAGKEIVYGVFDAAGPWLVVGAALAGVGAARESWKGVSVGLTVVVIGTVAAFFGPVGCWGVLAVGGCAALLVEAAVRYVQQQQA
jgi:hypothetical protein